MPTQKKTTVGVIDEEVLTFTAGKDVALDIALVEADCMGSAAHVTMLSRMPVKPALISKTEAGKVIGELRAILVDHAAGKFRIRTVDQDVHLAVERRLTKELGDLGKKIHTARSRNDQVAVDLRLWAKEQLLNIITDASALAGTLVKLGKKHVAVPMVGRTHMQPAMPSSVGLWATAHAEALLDDISLLMAGYELNDQCPLGAAAGYGVPLPIDRQLTSDLLGFSRPAHNVAYAVNARGKLESTLLQAAGQTMLSLSRIAQDLMLFTLPEFGYFDLPPEFCTGSSIMPNKNNPDVLELIRSRAAIVLSQGQAATQIVLAAPFGYNRDLQDTKEPFLEGLNSTRASLRVMNRMLGGLTINRKVMTEAFTPGVFATDRALELVGQGMPFRDAYHHVKAHLDELENLDPYQAIAAKTHLGGTAGLDFDGYTARIKEAVAYARDERKHYHKAVAKLLGCAWPLP